MTKEIRYSIKTDSDKTWQVNLKVHLLKAFLNVNSYRKLPYIVKKLVYYHFTCIES